MAHLLANEVLFMIVKKSLLETDNFNIRQLLLPCLYLNLKIIYSKHTKHKYKLKDEHDFKQLDCQIV